MLEIGRRLEVTLALLGCDVVLALELGHDNLVGVPGVLLCPEPVHLFERDVARLGEEEDDVREREDLHRAEEEVDAVARVAHVEEHGRSRARNDKVPCGSR